MVLGVAGLLAAPALLAQTPAGAVFRVDGSPMAAARRPAIASDAGGRFIVVWGADNDHDGSLKGVFAQRFAANGRRVGGEFQVNTTTMGNQDEPEVAASARGDVLVVWIDLSDLVTGQRFDPSGNRAGAEFRVTETYNPSRALAAAFSPLGSNPPSVVAWEMFDDLGSPSVFARRYDGTGAPLGSPFLVNTYTTGQQGEPALAYGDDGGFVVVWQSFGQDGSSYGVYGQSFNTDGLRRGGEFRVNVATTGVQAAPAITRAGDGFVALWSAYQDGDDVFARLLDAGGQPTGSEWRVNAYTTGDQAGVALATDAAGNVVATWGTFFQTPPIAVHGRRFDPSLAPREGDFVVASLPVNYLIVNHRSLAIDAVGNFVVVWGTGISQLPGEVIQARRFGGLRAAGLRVDSAGNGVIEPGEAVDVRTSWQNTNGSPLSVTSTASALAGPPGATYTLSDASASYGTLPDGGLVECTDCFGIVVSAPTVRPAHHWDATFLESIAPPALGQQKGWLLHVGASFDDVPLTSPFYRFVEALFHHSITAGCNGTSYCPAASTAREQMATLVLLAKEGAGFTVPPCSGTVFADVPTSSPYCRFIEELARRGVVTGCGGGSFCPQLPVTRQEIAPILLRTLDPSLDPPACSAPPFADVPVASPFCRWIAELARRRVVQGCGGSSYCPGSPVTREQMAVFITVTFGITLYGP